jgi:3-hydroxybutyryl-CoA dehydrogenase
MSAPERITVIGAGLMGHGIAQIFAAHGHPVRLQDSNEETLNSSKDRVRSNLTKMTSQGIKFGDGVEDILGRIETTGDMTAACEDCDFVFEAVFEDLEIKQWIFAELDDLCPSDTILCSNTSVISITEIARKSIPLVEVVRAEESEDRCTAATYDLLARVGKHPVHVHKDVPGFVGNRLQHALWREAFAIIDEEICDPATVDEVIRNGFGFRLPILGPVESADMIGLDLTLAIHDYILKYINADPTPSTTLQAKVKTGELGFKSGSGFLEWSEADMSASRQRLVDYLISALAERQK